jgi:hypothetical protein
MRTYARKAGGIIMGLAVWAGAVTRVGAIGIVTFVVASVLSLAMLLMHAKSTGAYPYARRTAAGWRFGFEHRPSPLRAMDTQLTLFPNRRSDVA